MQDPAKYETFKSLAASDAAEFVPQLIERMTWNMDEAILDFGCGAGTVAFKYLLPMAKLHNSKITGTDISKAMVDFAKKNYAHPLLQFCQGDILDSESPISGRLFDKIISVYVFHFINDSSTTFEKLYDILKPGGQIGFTAVAGSRMCDFMENLVKNSKWSSYLKDFNWPATPWCGTLGEEKAEERLRREIEQTGFVISEIRTEQRIYSNDLETFAEFFLSVSPFLKQIPQDLMSELKKDYCAGVLNCSTTTSDEMDPSKVQIQYSTVVCIASKPLPSL